MCPIKVYTCGYQYYERCQYKSGISDWESLCNTPSIHPSIHPFHDEYYRPPNPILHMQYFFHFYTKLSKFQCSDLTRLLVKPRQAMTGSEKYLLQWRSPPQDAPNHHCPWPWAALPPGGEQSHLHTECNSNTKHISVGIFRTWVMDRDIFGTDRHMALIFGLKIEYRITNVNFEWILILKMISICL